MIHTQAQIAAMRRSLVSLPVTCLVMALLLFLPAGTVHWLRGWVFEILFVIACAVAVAVIWRVNPEIFVARSRVQPGTEKLDYLFIAVIVTGFALILPVAGVDFRLGLSRMPDWLVVLGYVLFVLSFAGSIWPLAVSRYFEPGVRIQSDRGQTVIDVGPYAIIRHPGYSAAVVLALATALCLGSWWAFVPVLIVVMGLVPRTLFEERVLTAGLAGYAEYKTRVRYRWLPGVW